WTRAPTALRIPELDASDSAAVTRKINLPRPSPTRDPVANLNVMVGSVFEVHNHTLKLNGSAPNLKLERTETLAAVHGNPVVIISSVDIGSPKLLPCAFVATSLRTRGDGQAEQHQQQPNYTNRFVRVHSL